MSRQRPRTAGIIVGGYTGPKEDNNFYDYDSNNTECLRAIRDTRYVPDQSMATRDGAKEVGTPADSLNRVIAGLRYTREREGD